MEYHGIKGLNACHYVNGISQYKGFECMPLCKLNITEITIVPLRKEFTCVLQSSSSWFGPVQSAVLSTPHSRNLFRLPPPQLRLHPVQAVQAVHAGHGAGLHSSYSILSPTHSCSQKMYVSCIHNV